MLQERIEGKCQRRHKPRLLLRATILTVLICPAHDGDLVADIYGWRAGGL